MRLVLVLVCAFIIGGGVGVAIEDFTRFSYILSSSRTKTISAIFGAVAAIIITIIAYITF